MSLMSDILRRQPPRPRALPWTGITGPDDPTVAYCPHGTWATLDVTVDDGWAANGSFDFCTGCGIRRCEQLAMRGLERCLEPRGHVEQPHRFRSGRRLPVAP